MLNGFEYQVFLNVQQVTDEADHRYKLLCEFLNGAGCEDIETAWQELIYKDLYKDFEIFAKESLIPIVKEFSGKKENQNQTSNSKENKMECQSRSGKKEIENQHTDNRGQNPTQSIDCDYSGHKYA